MADSTRSVRARISAGAAAEDLAAALMRQAGFALIARNYRCRAGELDIVARRGDLLVIAEVRLRSSSRFGGALASVSAGKRLRILTATRYLLAAHPRLARLAIRFDVLATSSAAGPLEWIEGAF